MIKWSGMTARGLYSAVAVLLLHGCVSVPEQFRGEYPQIQPQAAQDTDIGRRIRWGGVILETRPGESDTCFEILSRPLSRNMRPAGSDQTLGRFIACRPGVLEPEVFARGREVTLTGTVEQLELRKVGEFDYRYPLVQADFITMWPERIDVIVPAYDPFYSPWYWHYPYYWYPPRHPPMPVRRSMDDGPRVDVPPASEGGG